MDGTGVVVEAYETFAADLRRFVASRTRDGNVVEDVVQEAFARLQSEALAGRTPTNPKGWLYRVSLNLVITGSRRAETARSKAHLMTADAVALSPEALFLSHERSLTLRAAIMVVGSVGARSLVLAAEGFTVREIAEAIGRSEGATRTLMCRARSALRSELDRGEAAFVA